MKTGKRTHFLIYVCFLDRIRDLQSLPEVYVVPSLELDELIYVAPGGRRLVQLRKLRKEKDRFQNAWQSMTGLQASDPELS